MFNPGWWMESRSKVDKAVPKVTLPLVLTNRWSNEWLSKRIEKPIGTEGEEVSSPRANVFAVNSGEVRTALGTRRSSNRSSQGRNRRDKVRSEEKRTG